MDKWALYDELVAAVPDDVLVKDYVLGINWSWVEAECGGGVAYTARGGATKGGKRDLRGMPLKSVCELAKSWCFEDATLGVAALNAWYSRFDQVEQLAQAHGLDVRFDAGHRGALTDPGDDTRPERGVAGAHAGAMSDCDAVDPFDVLQPRIESCGGQAKVVVVGHFPHVEDIGEYAQLTVLERNCRNDCDVPDPACEYVVPGADYVYLTGVTLINKTAPRLLELAERATAILVGPSAVPADALLAHGANMIGGRVVQDPEKARFCCATREPFGDALCSFFLLP